MALTEKIAVPPSAFKRSITHSSKLTLVVRDGITGEIKQVVEAHNNKLLMTYSVLVSFITGDVAMGSGSFTKMAIGSGADIASTDLSLTGLLSGNNFAPTAGNLSVNAASADGINWNLSASFSGTGGNAFTALQAAIFGTLCITAGLIWLKATFASVFVDSTDILNVAWLQSIQSA